MTISLMKICIGFKEIFIQVETDSKRTIINKNQTEFSKMPGWIPTQFGSDVAIISFFFTVHISIGFPQQDVYT